MQSKKEGNDLFFRILKNILTMKSTELYEEHIEDDTFYDIYSNVSIEKAISKCYDFSVANKLFNIQPKSSRIIDCKHHYWYLLKTLPKTNKYIDWKQQ